jgi:glycerol-3-phosphate O-acyltransferase
LARVLMTRIRDAVPILPVPLAALALHRAGGTAPLADLAATGARWAATLAAQGAHLHLGADPAAAVGEGLDALALRGMVRIAGGTATIVPGEEGAVAFYANSIAHHLEARPAPMPHPAPEGLLVET